jgi:hypothetical protein
MKVIIYTQVYENYGTGSEPYWKPKVGDEYAVTNIWDQEEATTAVMVLREQIESDNEGYRETIVGWDLVDNDYLTEFERSQLEYEGKITFPAKELVWN